MRLVKDASKLHKSLQYDQITKDDYIKNAGLTSEGSPSEAEVFLLRSKGSTILEMSFKLNCSTRTIERRIRSIKFKISIYELKKALVNFIK